ncbi:hypothetical protein BD626DRAFT_430022 [Schizophyllum amplum]|uniref:TFIIS N-terminal domain-containing protein n=1 Tax=Schizophyllum amplum TaxID=97359 RepID=A0A550CHR9_9AGAR|nr:hypothetical protein BD626DRAFT_430022 [Auriculariopsis ampla]
METVTDPLKITERDIFGSDSELSEEEFDNKDDGGASDGSAGSKQKPKQAKKKTRRREDEDRTLRKRKRKEPAAPTIPDDETPEQARRRLLNQRIDEVIKPKKSNRPRKRKGNEEVLDSFADDEVARLREAMREAVEEDKMASKSGLPAVAKLRLLPVAMDTLRKASLAQSIIDNNLLQQVREWLEPHHPDPSLPALNIQRELFGALRKMDFIDASVLKESGLGKVVVFYTRCKRVTPEIQRIAGELYTQWARPIMKRSASYRDRMVPQAQRMQAVRQERLPAIMAKAAKEEGSRARRNAVTIPQRELGDYTLAPVPQSASQNTSSVLRDIERRKMQNESLKQLNRKLLGAKQ